MSLPTTQSNFSSARVFEYWTERPLISNGDSSPKIHHLRCKVKADNYSTPSLNALMSSAINAGVISLPFTDPSAYFVGDSNVSPSDGGLMTFDRKFATIPSTRVNELVGSRSFPFPSIREVVYKPPRTLEDLSSQEPWEYKDVAASNTNPAPLYVDTKYKLSKDINVGDIEEVFRPTQGGVAVDFVSDSGSGAIINGKALNGDVFTASYSVAGTTPTATSYNANVLSGLKLVVDVQVERYIGEIFAIKTFYMKAQ